nr:GSCFA domain-containing protein [Arthrobacter pigmenti]
MYSKKFSISGKKIATAGSCFAQEIARELRKHGHTVIDKEPSPNTIQIRGDLEKRYGYGLYSARHGNIYTVRQLLQLTKEAFGLFSPEPEDYIWERDGRFYDALRPNVEPDGLPTKEEVTAQRRDHLRRFRNVIEESDVFVFTLGLTEAWGHRESGLVYPSAPGVLAGDYDPEVHHFLNFGFMEIYLDFLEFRKLAKEHNPSIEFILTVSPVPLTATAADSHVLVSTVRSKSVLRAVTAELYEEFLDVDYFPSYELFSTPFLGPSMFNENKRNVTRKGVEAVMRIFFSEHDGSDVAILTEETDNDAVCEEALLDAFAGGSK